MEHDLSSIWLHLKPYLAVAAFALAFGAVITVLSLGRAKIVDGWRILRPTPLLYGLGVLCIPISLGLLIVGGQGLTDARVLGDQPHPQLYAAGMVVLGLIFPYCTVTTFFVRIRFNDQGVQKSWFGRPRFTSWTEIKKLERSVFKGPQLVTRTGRGIAVSAYLAGFRELVQMAKAKDVEVDAEFE
jgi:hypothetical protein